jgi:hypothetical protein
MTFNTKGYLDAGLHNMDVKDVENMFVTNFPHSSTRQSIIEGFKKHAAEIGAIIDECTKFLDVSFVTNKNDPGDIDMVCFIDGDKVDSLSLADQSKLQALVAGPATKATHKCDAYFCPTYPDGHPKHAQTRLQRKYWMGEFGYDRSDVPKGIVVVEVKPPAAPAPSSPPTTGGTP